MRNRLIRNYVEGYQDAVSLVKEASGFLDDVLDNMYSSPKGGRALSALIATPNMEDKMSRMEDRWGAAVEGGEVPSRFRRGLWSLSDAASGQMAGLKTPGSVFRNRLGTSLGIGVAAGGLTGAVVGAARAKKGRRGRGALRGALIGAGTGGVAMPLGYSLVDLIDSSRGYSGIYDAAAKTLQRRRG